MREDVVRHFPSASDEDQASLPCCSCESELSNSFVSPRYQTVCVWRAVSGVVFPKHIILASVPRTVPRSALSTTARRVFEPQPLSPPTEQPIHRLIRFQAESDGDAQRCGRSARPPARPARAPTNLASRQTPTHTTQWDFDVSRFCVWSLFWTMWTMLSKTIEKHPPHTSICCD